jgi:hypothetical protein
MIDNNGTLLYTTRVLRSSVSAPPMPAGVAQEG